MTDSLKQNTYEYGTNALYIAEIYEQYLNDRNSVDESWKEYFASLGDNVDDLRGDLKTLPWGKSPSQIVGYVDQSKKDTAPKSPANVDQGALDSIHAHMLIRAYRVRGHLLANLDPLGLDSRSSHPELDPAHYGFGDDDFDHPITIGGWLDNEQLTLREILNILKKTYCSDLAVEFIHMQSLKRKEWLENRLEKSLSRPTLSKDEKRFILQKLVETVGFEEFLQKKFPGAKRFSAEGGEALMPAMEAVVETAARLGVKEVVLGMPHRGRLNVLTAFMGKPYESMLSEFQGNLATPDWINSSGDVKYHLGLSTDKKFGGNEVHLSLTANPSHLEAVNPVVIGKVRAKQDQHNDENRDKVMGVLLHGDAAFCGQGVVAETLSLNDLEGYKTGGTVHMVVNNQIGFTTTPKEQHTSPYPTDVAMAIQAPIFHINGEDPEAVVHASRIAAEFRQEFKKDVIIDIWCYRKHGHNEGDEPRWTQPKMYEVIDKKETPREVYAKKLIAEGSIADAEFEKMKSEFYNELDKAFTKANEYKPEKADMLEGKWGHIKTVQAGEKEKIITGVEQKALQEIGKVLSTIPQNVKAHKGVDRVMKNRAKMVETGKGLDWAMGEAFAFGSLLKEGHPIRLSGQDVVRGTFSHRHSGITDQNSEETYFPLNHLEKDQKAKYEAINSNLSEYAVLGYEYGYSTAEPNTLTIWEAQFGDFANGAQIMFDQFISSAEVKWLRMSGLVVLLPHGYEGQGPEHSSARIERYLQQCAEDNMIVANCSTPANYFHILRRQLQRDFRKPLIIFTPKSLLRHKLAQSSMDDIAGGTMFKRIIPETQKLVTDKKVRKVVFCSGKVYYELLEKRTERKINDVALVRIEQYYPYTNSAIVTEAKRYKNAEFVWCQEEPENMGAWNFLDRKLEQSFIEAGGKCKRPTYVGRKEAAATACGYMKIHTKEQQELVDEALS